MIKRIINYFKQKKKEKRDKMVEEKIKDIIAEQLCVDRAIVVDDAHMVDDLGSDSLDAIELIMALEEEFSFEIPDEDAAKLPLVKDIVTYIKNKIGNVTTNS